MDRGVQWATVCGGHKESDTTENTHDQQQPTEEFVPLSSHNANLIPANLPFLKSALFVMNVTNPVFF